MSIKIDPKSMRAVARIARLVELTRAGVQFAAYTSGKGLVKTTSAEILRKPKSGRTYVRRDRLGRRRRHVASAPGETHANRTGKLRRSLGFKVRGHRQLEFGYGAVKADAPVYAEYVENGTTIMKARPSLQNGIRAENRNFENNIRREVGQRLEGKGGLIK